jgi:hypothetical protein
MMRHRIIVARDRPELLETLVRKFSVVSSVEVITDRRDGERRQRAQLRLPDRRQGDRREATADVQAELWVDGYVVVRVG